MKPNFLAGTLLCLLSNVAYTQSNRDETKYRMKDVALTTRWAKQVNPNNVLPEYPRPQMVRSNWKNLNGLWQYAIVAAGHEPPATYDGKILVPFPIESALSGVKKTLNPPPKYNKTIVSQNELWYKRKFNAPILHKGEKLLLHFGAVSWEATVYVNGEMAGTHTGSYTGFTIDITQFVRNRENEISVRVRNPLEKGFGPRGKQSLSPSSIWYTSSSGIWQTVWIEKVPKIYIRSIKVIPDVDRSQVRISVDANMEGMVTVKAAGEVVNGHAGSDIIVSISHPRLWSPDDPYLYDLTIVMGEDIVKSYFGLRKIEIKKDVKGKDRIFLNNEYIYNLGTLDQGFWPDGLYTAPTDAALKFDVEAIKLMGFNTIRKHVKVEPARWYYHADKLGMLVWQDLVPPATKFGSIPGDESKKEFEKESAEILSQLCPFPSIVTWVVFNEHWGEYDQGRITKWVKAVDPSRLVNGHSGSIIASGKVNEASMEDVIRRSQFSDMTDIHSYPSPALALPVQNKANVLGEYGGIDLEVQGHQYDDILGGWGYSKAVNAGRIRKEYEIMVDSLVEFEKRGLSGSIYTQPFDVETEQNGLMTYDREVIKIPAEILRNIHAKLWPVTKNFRTALQDFSAKVADTSIKDFTQMLIEFKKGVKDSTSLRALSIMAIRMNDSETADSASREYMKRLKDPLSEINVSFISFITNSSRHPGYELVLKNLEKIRARMDATNASRMVQRIIFKEQVKPLLTENPDWGTVQQVIKKYPQTDGEFIVGNSVVFYRNAVLRKENNAMKNFIEVATWYDDRYNGGTYNEWAWETFEGTSDTNYLKKALEWSKKSMVETPNDANCIDTYANLLYKLGYKNEAVKWEERARTLNPHEPAFDEALKRMQNGQPTWPVAENLSKDR